jgi:hypothetical protein
MDLVKASMKEEDGQHVHGWENVMLVKESAVIMVSSYAGANPLQLLTTIVFMSSSKA